MTIPRIAIKRLRAEITQINNARKFGIGLPVHPAEMSPRPVGVDYLVALGTYNKETARFSAARATQLYSLRSHLRGTLHITHRYIQKAGRYPGDVVQVCVSQNYLDQAALIGPVVEEFTMTPEEAAVAEKERRARVIRYGTVAEIDALHQAEHGVVV